MSTQSVAVREAATRQSPSFGGFNLTILGLEVRRMLRNKRTIIFGVLMPIVLFLVFGLNKAYRTEPAGHGNVTAYIITSMGLYGAVLATASGGAMVAIERMAGWSRQLRVTPLSPVAYVAVKVLTALVLGLASIVVLFIVGRLTGAPSMPGYLWVVTGACIWVGSLVFAAFGLFMGYLLPTENAMQLQGFALLLFSFGGGLFIPLSQFPHALQDIAKFTPLWGLNQLVHAPLLGGSIDTWWVVNAVAWLAIFSIGAMLLFRRDTARG
jgi:ABC-2 type transport system permease protein